jgi:hypothetical protein
MSLAVLVASGVSAGGATAAWAGDGKSVVRKTTSTALAATYCVSGVAGLYWSVSSVQDTNGAQVNFWCEPSNGFVYHQWQLSGGGWSSPSSLGSPPNQHLVGTPYPLALPSGQLVVFAIGEDLQLWHKWQLCDGCSWSGWVSLGGGLASNPVVVRKTDGTLVAFAVAFNRDLWHKWQLCNGCSWSGWNSLGGGPFVGDIGASVLLGGPSSADDRLQASVVRDNTNHTRAFAIQPCPGCAWGGPTGWIG